MKSVARRLIVFILALAFTTPLPTQAAGNPNEAVFLSTGINGWVSDAITVAEIRFSGPDIVKYTDCKSMVSALNVVISEKVNDKSDAIYLKWARTTTLRITPNGLECKFIIGYAYDSVERQQLSVALIPPIVTKTSQPATISISIDGVVIGTSSTTYRVSGDPTLRPIFPLRGEFTGTVTSIRIDYSLASDESAPTDWKIETTDSHANKIQDVLSQQVSDKEWFMKFPSPGIYRVSISGSTTINGCGSEPTLGNNVYVNGACPTKKISGDLSIQVVPNATSAVPTKHTIAIECEEIYVDRSANCKLLVNSQDVFGSDADEGKTFALEVTRKNVSGALVSQKINVRTRVPYTYLIPQGIESVDVSAKIINTEIQSTVTASPHVYTLSESVNASWKLSCKAQQSFLVCKALPDVKAKAGLQLPSDLRFSVLASTYSLRSYEVETIQLKEGALIPGSEISFSVKDAKLVESVKIGLAGVDVTEKWTNTSYEEPFTTLNTKLVLNCPNRISGNFFKCTIRLNSTGSSNGSVSAEIQYKTNKVGWKKSTGLTLKSGITTSVSVPNKLDSTLVVRALAKLADGSIYSETRSWTADAPASSNVSDPRVAAIKEGLRNECRNLPSSLSVSYVGAGPSSGGNPSRKYSVNGVFTLAIYDLGSSWNFGAWPIFGLNQDTAEFWDCGYGGRGAVLLNYFVSK
jgi:hypothetical protein